MGQDQAAWAVGDALLNPRSANDVLLVIRPGADDEARLLFQDVANSGSGGVCQLAFLAAEQRIDAHQILELVGDSLSFQQLDDFGANVVEGLLVDEAAIENRRAAVRDGGGLPAARRLAGVDGIQVDARPLGLSGLDGRLAGPSGQDWLELGVERLHQASHLLGGVDSQTRHAAVADAADGGELEPVHAAVADAHPFGVERLGDDHVFLILSRDAAGVAQIGHPREAAAFFVWRGALLHGAFKRKACAADGFHGKDGRGDARFLIARSTAVDPPLTQISPERVQAPARPGRDDVVVAIEVQRWATRVQHTDDVDARIRLGVFGQTFGGQRFHGVAKLAQLLGDDVRALGIALAGRVDRWDSDERLGEGDDFSSERIDRAQTWASDGV